MPAFRHVLRAALLSALLVEPACGGSKPTEPVGVPGADAYLVTGRLATPETSTQAPLNVVMVVIDTWRADALGSPGGEGSESPASSPSTPHGHMPLLTKRAESGVAFTNAAAPSSWTLPSLTSLLTGRLPSDHRIEGEEGQATGLATLPTLAEMLSKNRRHETVAWVGGPWGHGEGGMFEGFDVVINGVGLQATPGLVSTWSRRRDPHRPFFLLVHTFEAHDPYGQANHPFPWRALTDPERPDPLSWLGPDVDDAELVRAFVLDGVAREAILRNPEQQRVMKRFTHAIGPGYAERPDPELAAELRGAYHAGLGWVDGLLDRALTSLEGAGLLRNTLLIVTGDHGEAFGEHGMLLHARRLDDELLRVPLMVWGPAPFDTPQRVPVSVGLVDVLPTVLDLQRLPALGGAPGRSLVPCVRDLTPGHPTVAQVVRKPLHTGGESNALLESVRSDSWKVIITFDLVAGTVREEAFDLRLDPEERRDLASADGFVRDLPFETEFCIALEEARERIWQRVAEALLAPEAIHGAAAERLSVAQRPLAGCLSTK